MSKALFITCLLAGLAAAQGPAPLVGHWRFDELGGTTAFDSGPFSNNGTLVGFAPVTFGPGQLANGLTFDGVDDYVACATNFGLPRFPTGTPFSVTAWVNSTGASDVRFFSEGSSLDANPLFTLGCGGGAAASSLRAFVRADGGSAVFQSVRESTAVVFDGTWHHIAYADNGNGSARLFVDGVPDATDFSYLRSGTFTMDLVAIGAVLRATPCCFFPGQVDDLRVYPFEVNAKNVATIMVDGLLTDGFQQNQPGASLSMNGSLPSLAGPASATVAQGGILEIALSANTSGLPFDLFLSPNPTSANRLVLAPLAIVNLQPSSVAFLNGFFSTAFGPPPLLPGFPVGTGAFATTLTYTAPNVPLFASIQFAILDPAAPVGIALSGAAELTVQ